MSAPKYAKERARAHGYFRGMLLPSAYFGSVSWMSHHLAGHPMVANGRFVRQTIRCRCLILGPNGVQQLGVPVRKHGNLAQMEDILIDDSQPWRARHWRALTSAYRNSPYFEYFEDEIRGVIMPPEPQLHLAEFNAQSLAATLRLMATRPKTEKTSAHAHINPWDRHDRPFADRLAQQPYRQVWSDRYPFEPDLSILDLLFCTGRGYAEHLLKVEG